MIDELLKSWDVSKLSFSPRNEDARFVVTQIKSSINNLHYRIITDIDDQGNLQAICVYRLYADYTYISLIATAPWNLLLSHPLKARGGPTRLIQKLLKLYSLPIELVSLDSSEGFYEKLGFIKNKETGRYVLFP